MQPSTAEWCPVCSTRHDEAGVCPGEVAATGEEAVSSKSMYLTPRGWEIYGVLTAPVGDRYRARIASLPRTLWTVPGGTGTIKFLGDSADDVEKQADEFIRTHCKKRLYRPIEDVTIQDPSGNPDEPLVDRRNGRSAPRKDALLWAMWGTEEPREEARTYNLSVDGMFLVTTSPAESGTPVKILLHVADGKVMLSGTVVWSRQQPEQGRPCGMGILLNRPPDCYIEYIRQLF
jgi:hypothetical protein